MQLPDKIVLPFAADGEKNTIPIDSQVGIVDGATSYATGFPPLTMVPIEEGGIPPVGEDFNGIFNVLSEIARWAVAGGMYGYDADFATSPHTGGYPIGATIRKSNGKGIWVCIINNNTSDPDEGGSGWQDLFLWLKQYSGLRTYVKTSGYVFFDDYLVNTTDSPLTLTLPSNPQEGDTITFEDCRGYWGVNHLTLGRNGQTIQGLAEDLVVNIPDLKFTIWYNGTDWRLV